MQNVSGELIVSGLDSATSLIQAAKNLMNAVVLTVKASYVASTKYPRQAAAEGINAKPVVVWKMRVGCVYFQDKVPTPKDTISDFFTPFQLHLDRIITIISGCSSISEYYEWGCFLGSF